tara:strand:+ start:694 stop:948 length:255 start_codon:yes stop_codon:yes gene_type:complete
MKKEYEISQGKKYAILWRKKGNDLTDKCPFCHQKHRHGKEEGHRIGHCADVFDEKLRVISLVEGFVSSDGSCFRPKDGYIIREY